MTVMNFRGEYFFLSNMCHSPFVLNGRKVLSVEHGFHACKTLVKKEQEWVLAAPNARQAKRRGRKVTLREGWNKRRVDVMRKLLAEKFAVNSVFAGKLLDTGNWGLVEGNSWNDTFWGVCNGRGKNVLGELLMARREFLRNV